jgi:hemolysin D
MTAWAVRTFPNLAHHWSVLRESWSIENAADLKKKPISDHEFLPAALEIIEKPASPGLRWLLLIVCAFFAIAVLWSVIGTIDVVAVARGKIVPAGNVKIIQPIEIGAVRAIHVRNGQHVSKGQLLIELDPTLAGADEAQAVQQLLASDVVQARNKALLSYLDNRSAEFVAPPGTSAAVAANQDHFVRNAIAEYEAQRAGLVQQRAAQAADLTSANAQIAKLEQTLPMVNQQLAARKAMTERGYFSKLKLLEYEQLRVEHIQDIAIQSGVAAKARAGMASAEADLAKLRLAFSKGAVAELSEAADRSAIAGQELRKSERRRSFQELHSPVNGTVQQLMVATIGGIVQPAQALMVVVPDDSAVEVEAMIQNRDIGFVREGQAVRVKLDAFPFTDYGLIEGVVESISRDAVEPPATSTQRGNESGSTPIGPYYLARVHLDRTSIRVAGHDQPIGPGLAVQAEVKTGERRIIGYLLSPITRAFDEAGRER